MREKTTKQALPSGIEGNAGFTLIEIMVALFISLFVVAAVLMVYNVQHRNYGIQEQVVDMQQNLRTALDVVTSDLRMSGYDPYKTGDFKLKKCEAERLVFVADFDNDRILEASDEVVAFKLKDGSFSRKQGSGDYQAIADGIENIQFRCMDKAGKPITDSKKLEKAFTIEINMLAKSRRGDEKFENTAAYPLPDGTTTWGPFNDHHRRRMLSTVIYMRNMGI